MPLPSARAQQQRDRPTVVSPSPIILRELCRTIGDGETTEGLPRTLRGYPRIDYRPTLRVIERAVDVAWVFDYTRVQVRGSFGNWPLF